MRCRCSNGTPPEGRRARAAAVWSTALLLLLGAASALRLQGQQFNFKAEYAQCSARQTDFFRDWDGFSDECVNGDVIASYTPSTPVQLSNTDAWG